MRLLILSAAALLFAAACGVPEATPVREGTLLAVPAPAPAPVQQAQPALPQALPPTRPVPLAAPARASVVVPAQSGCSAAGKPARLCPPP